MDANTPGNLKTAPTAPTAPAADAGGGNTISFQTQVF